MTRVTVILSFLLSGLTFILYYIDVHPGYIFAVSGVALVFLAVLLGWATEAVAERMGSAWGGFLNATLGNGAEILIAILAVKEGLITIVKASITGSIIGNSLFVLGGAFFFGGIRYKELKFNPNMAMLNNSMMALVISALLIPSILTHLSVEGFTKSMSQSFSLLVSIILIVIYFAGLIFLFRTHRGLFKDTESISHRLVNWGFKKSVIYLVITTAVMIGVVEILINTVEPTLKSLGWGELFMGAVVLALIGNAAENSIALLFAWRKNMDLAFSICINSAQQIAIFVAPLAVIFGFVYGVPMDLNFHLLEVIAISLSTLILVLVTVDHKTNWLEGVQLIGLYLVFAIAFYFIK